MKVAAISSNAAIFILYCYAIPCSITAAGIPDIPIDANQDEKEAQSPIAAGMVNDGEKKLNTLSEFNFTQEEIEKGRIVTIHWYGDEEVSTDEEVIQTLEYARRDNSTFLFNEPHFSEDIKKRDIIGSDNCYHRHSSQTSAPYSVVGYLSTSHTGCTAYLVGPRHLLTAAHCLHPNGNTGAIFPPSQVTFYLRRNCHTSGMRYTILDVLVYQQYRNSGDEDYDIACLLLSASVVNWMGFAYRDPMPRVSAEICGYPGDQVCGYIVRDVVMLRGYLAGGVGLGAIHVFGTRVTQWEEPVVAP